MYLTKKKKSYVEYYIMSLTKICFTFRIFNISKLIKIKNSNESFYRKFV